MDEVKIEQNDASVYVKIGRTKSLGNYETIRMDIGFIIPCKKKNLLKVYRVTKQKIEELLDEELEKYERASNSEEISF